MSQQHHAVYHAAGGMQQLSQTALTSSQPPIQWTSTASNSVSSNVVTKYAARVSIVLGGFLIVCGAFSIVFNIVELSLLSVDYSFNWGIFCHGFWCGLMAILAGCFGIGAGIHKTKCLIVTFNVFCIIAAILTMVGQFTIGVMGAVFSQVFTATDCSTTYNDYNDYDFSTTASDCHLPDVGNIHVAMETLLALFAVIETVLAICGSAICCKVHCCCCYSTVEPVQVYFNAPRPTMFIAQTNSSSYPAAVPYREIESAGAVPAEIYYNYPKKQPTDLQP